MKEVQSESLLIKRLLKPKNVYITDMKGTDTYTLQQCKIYKCIFKHLTIAFDNKLVTTILKHKITWTF